MAFAIDRRARLPLAEFRADYVARSRPVILADAIEHWPARRKWSFDYFASTYAGKTVRFDRKEWKVGDVIGALRKADGVGPVPYLKEVKLDEQFPELWPDVPGIEYAKGNRLRSKFVPRAMRIERGIVALFIGSKGSGFRKLHWDYSFLHVFISQVHGGKEVVVFAPDQTRYLYPNPDQENLSLIGDPYNVDAKKFPDFALAESTKFTVNEGETLFLPAGWWHATEIVEPSIAIAESTLDRYNWTRRKDWYLAMYRRNKVPALKCLALNVYLTMLNSLI
jgi:hypothetical protein